MIPMVDGRRGGGGEEGPCNVVGLLLHVKL